MFVIPLLALALCQPAGAGTLPYSEDVPVVGGHAALARALGLTPAPDRSRFVAELIRLVYDVPEGKNTKTDELLGRLSRHLDAASRFQRLLAAAQPEGGGIRLEMAARKPDRKRLKRFLDLFGLKLREHHRHFSVEQTDNKHAAEQRRLLSDLGIDLRGLAARLNQGRTVHIDVPTDRVPVPLPLTVWSTAVFQRSIALPQLFTAILSDRRAALLCHGLAALDTPTLQFLAGHPNVVKQLYDHAAAAFAAFGDALVIRNGRVVPPGGSGAVPLWEGVLKRSVSRPERFVPELFRKDSGRVAYLYETVSHLDRAHARFAMGLWMSDPSVRLDRFKTLVSEEAGTDPEWHVDSEPFARPPADVALLLTQIAVDPSGAPAAPAEKRLWDRAFSGDDLPDNAVDVLKHLNADGAVDAAWLLSRLGNLPNVRTLRLDQLAFGQRVFAHATRRELPDVLLALRAVVRYRMLMFALERLGIRSAAVYATAAQRAEQLSTLNADSAFVAFGQFQSALAIIVRLHRVRRIDTAEAQKLVTTLAGVPLDENGRYAGGVARWMTETLLPAIGGSGDADARLLAALAGREPAAGTDAPITWEGHRYVLDLAATERRRLLAVRRKLHAPPVARPLLLERLVTELTRPGLTLSGVRAVHATLVSLLASTPPQPKHPVLPPGVDKPKKPRDLLKRAIHDLSKIHRTKDLKKAARAAEPLVTLVDDSLGDALMTWVYALDLGAPSGSQLLAGNVSRRHDFGFTDKNGERRKRLPWSEPVPQVAPGVPWHVRGSLLGLDVGLASLALRRTTMAPLAQAPVLSLDDRTTFVATVAVLNPYGLRDADLDSIAAAIQRGRARVAALVHGKGKLDAIADAVRMDGWRRRALAWSLLAAPREVESFFSLDELLALGAPSRSFNQWGVDGGPTAGCLCTMMPAVGRWLLFVGRPASGVLPTQVADLNLRVALALHRWKLPAALAPGVLAAATLDFVNQVHPVDDNDWLTFVRSAQALSRDHLDNYVAGLTAVGPLVPVPGRSEDR